MTAIGTLLDPRTIEVYLMAHGWEPRRRTDKFSTWVQAENGGVPAHVFLPLARGLGDFEQRLEDVVAQLAAVEHRDVEVVLTNLRYAAADLVRIRLASPRVGPGELPIDHGRQLFDGARDLMLAAACAALDPRPAYGTRKPNQAMDYLEHVRLGQTEPGSYVVTVISDVEPPEQTALIPDEAAHFAVPFERRVTTQLVQALSATRAATDRVLSEHTDVATAFEETVDDGVSANLCDALTTMGAEQAGAHVQITIDWAASRPPVVALASVVAFEPAALPVVRDAVAVLRQLGPFENEPVEGIVSRLIRGKSDEVGTIVIEGVARGERRNVHVELPEDQYALAIRAHDTRATVRLHGTLERHGRTWVLKDPGQLAIVFD